MSIPDIIDLSSDDEAESMDIKDIKTHLLSNVNGSEAIEQKIRVPNNYCGTNQPELHTNEFYPASGPPNYPLPVCRQFWKSGEYESGKDLIPSPLNGKSRLRIHPKFLHSNATSHKWAFGAIAELLDNAVDEVKNGATFVIVDRFIDPHYGNPALLIRDDGGGMDPNSLRRCISFGFSDKQADCSIGQYGNGFKTSTMRLGADAIVFSRCMSNRKLTQSVGLLSYTFLMQTRSDDIVVLVIDYEFNKLNSQFERLLRHDQKQFSANLTTILRWSPFSSEEELLKQFNDIGEHGTKIIIYNLWFNDDGTMELDFESNPEDIMISGLDRTVKTNSIKKSLTQDHVANQLHYSLRVYASVLYLHMPINFSIILRGRVVEPHNIVNDLNYLECVKYTPKANGIGEAEVVTFIGYLKGAPNVNVHGFSVYHRNRLILPFWKVANNSYEKCRGVAGVLEANFIKPTHDKQDFEKSLLYQKLENRLKEMTYEYWDYHCHLLGYTKSKAPNLAVCPTAPRVPQLPQPGPQSSTKQQTTRIFAPEPSISTQEILGTSLLSADRNATTSLNALAHSKLGKSSKYDVHQKVIPEKRRCEGHPDRAAKKQVMMVVDSDGRSQRAEDLMAVMHENKKLRSQCSEYEEEEKQLLFKEKRLRSELEEVQMTFKKLLAELKSNYGIKAEE